VISLPRRIFQAGQDVFDFKGGVVTQNFGVVGPGTEELQDIYYAHPSSTQTRPTTAFAWFNCDALEHRSFVVHCIALFFAIL
jgi:hypothetical protein